MQAVFYFWNQQVDKKSGTKRWKNVDKVDIQGSFFDFKNVLSLCEATEQKSKI